MNKLRVVVTGSAGFIGASVSARLRRIDGIEVVGIDNFNDYYDVKLKRARARFLTPGMVHHEADIADESRTSQLIADFQPDVVVHLAAQAGVRHSFDQPMQYCHSNLTGQVSLLEAVQKANCVKRLIYASSSSVYSGVTQLPFREDTRLGTPKSLYAATKIADEVLVDTYSDLFGIDAIGLRFFTVYGPWGRPDMAYWNFANSIVTGQEIKLFNFGDVRRDFTYIDDISDAILSMVRDVSKGNEMPPQHRLYNIGNHSPEPVRNMISILEEKLARKARVVLAPLPPGDMVETYADVHKLQTDFGFAPDTPLERGLASFVDWFRDWRQNQLYNLSEQVI